MNKNILIIPSLNPTSKLINLLEEFKIKANEEAIEVEIIIVNDGSDEKYDEIFFKIEKKGITVLKHAVNLGKGRALKTALNYALNNIKDFQNIITADSDGQHSVNDIISCLKEAKKKSDTLILGVRNFTQKQGIKIPLRSKLGNILTSVIFKYLLGINVSDTQTGLRVFSQKQARDFLKVNGEKFEYETNMLIENKNLGYKFKEKEIDTIYIEDNKSSHFNPITDSISIYLLFLKYTAVSILSFLIDILLFKIFIIANFSIIFSTINSRIISSIFNYTMNKNKVFKTFSNKNFFKYYILVIIQMFISSYSLKFLSEITKNKNLVFLKIIVDIVIFIINFYIQREWIFKKEA